MDSRMTEHKQYVHRPTNRVGHDRDSIKDHHPAQDGLSEARFISFESGAASSPKLRNKPLSPGYSGFRSDMFACGCNFGCWWDSYRYFEFYIGIDTNSYQITQAHLSSALKSLWTVKQNNDVHKDNKQDFMKRSRYNKTEYREHEKDKDGEVYAIFPEYSEGRSCERSKGPLGILSRKNELTYGFF
ncbi:hypothetical protein BDV93DRAFT_511039 [Ceratobasidium sp. AG-I]|nr:hypothetical protein BDV93DRAFT_511039 [Ceratobasidium sp. AG-I]